VRGNVHDAGIFFPEDLLGDILTEAAGCAHRYQPDPLGQRIAREALARAFGGSPEHILLTPGTSLSYLYAFLLLAEPGDEILCPRPSYPLFEYIARLARVELTSYPLEEHAGWRIDLAALGRGITERTRAIVLISPHNPTGLVADRPTIDGLSTLAREHGLAVVADEVFGPFTYGAEPVRPSDSDAPLVLSLNGFSKMYALPGMKVGWMSVSGDAPLVERALATLEMISDTFLPVNEVAQFSVPRILAEGGSFLARYRASLASLRSTALSELGPAAGVPPMGGFYMVIPLREGADEEALAVAIAEEQHVLVHPGYFYDIDPGHLVLSFVGEPGRVRGAIGKLRDRIGYQSRL
jgi:aspartate/methionine/tyrosine aminotransferase